MKHSQLSYVQFPYADQYERAEQIVIFIADFRYRTLCHHGLRVASETRPHPSPAI